MQIQFKQSEIIAALKQYIVTQGINLQGKSVEIAFSATRGAAGIVADVTIEEASIPGFSDASPDEATKPTLSVVSPAPADSNESDASAEQPEQSPPSTPTSLFN